MFRRRVSSPARTCSRDLDEVFVCGTVGAICCLFMEAALFIVRGVREDERDQKNREQQDADGSMITKSKNEFANNSRSSNNDSTMKKEN